MRKLTIGVALMAVIALSGAFAQQQQQGPSLQQNQQSQVELKDGELQKFVAVLQEVQQVQSQAQQDMQSSLEEEGLSQQRFSEIHRQKQGNSGSGSNSGSGAGEISRQEQQAYQAVLSRLQEIRQSTSEEIQTLIKDEGFSLDRFNAVYRAVQQRPQLQQRVQNMLQSSG